MSDLSFMNQAQFALQDAQAARMANKVRNTDTSQLNTNSFQDVLSAEQRRDPSHIDAMQRKKIHQTAVDFEAQFLSQMLQPMFEGIEVDAPFGGGHAEKMWQSMLVNEYGKSLAQSGGIGLAEQVERQLLRAQEGM
jgi:flagellar protein FlgJ